MNTTTILPEKFYKNVPVEQKEGLKAFAFSLMSSMDRNAFETVVCYTKAEIDSATICEWRY